MTRRKLQGIMAALLLVSCGKSHPSSQLADVAAYKFFRYFLYVRDQADVVRFACDEDREVYDRSTCQGAPTRISASHLYAALSERFASGTAPVERRLGDLRTRLEQTDFRLLELLNGATGPVDERLKPAMDQAVQRLSAAAPALQEKRDQVARLEAAVARQASADLYAQLITARKELGEASENFTRLTAEATAARKAYVDANASLLDEVSFQALSTQRGDIVASIENARYELTRETNRTVAVARTIQMIEDGGPTWVQSHEHPDAFRNGEVFQALHGLTEDLDLAARTFATRAATGATHVSVPVSRPGKLEQFHCRFDQRGDSSCQALKVTTPAGRSIRTTNSFTHRWSDHDAAPEVFAAEAQGIWSFDILWECAGSRPVDNAPECLIELASATGLSTRP